ncbi:MAG: M48 family metallopeptidase [Cyanobacteriota bacterium]|nr:M48 family metallopeptidase [Cyanobacteriota bacterium]
MKYTPKEITEEVNVTKVNPLVNFAYLLGTVVGFTLLVYLGLGIAANILVPRISSKREKQIGDLLAPAVTAQLNAKKIEDDKRIEYIEDLIESLQGEAPNREIPLTVHLLDSTIQNAAALAGGHVFVTTGFLKSVKSENELAFVLAHELGHLAARDSLKALGRSLPLMFIFILVDFGTSGTSGTPNIIKQTTNLSAMNYSREQEYAADVYGLSAAIARYGHGGNSLDFFERIAEIEDQMRLGNNVSEYFLTHPLTQKRIDILKQLAAENGWSMEGEITPLPDGLKCSNFECGGS